MDPRIRICTQAISQFHFGLVEKEDPETGEIQLTKENPETNEQVGLDW